MAEGVARIGSLQGMAIRYSHAIATAVLAVFAFIGFQNFYLRGQTGSGGPIAEELLVYAVLHGVCFTAWMLLLVLQPLLVANRWQKLHKTLGWWFLGLAALIPVTGALVAYHGTKLDPHLPVHALEYRQFLLVMLTEMVVFAGLVITAVVNRKRAHIHRSMMLLTGLAILSAATDRTVWIQALTGHAGWWGMFAPELLLGVLFIAVRWPLLGKPDRWFTGGLAVMMALYFVAFDLAKTATWNNIMLSVFGF